MFFLPPTFHFTIVFIFILQHVILSFLVMEVKSFMEVSDSNNVSKDGDQEAIQRFSKRFPDRSKAIQEMTRSVQSRPEHLVPIDYGVDHPFDKNNHRQKSFSNSRLLTNETTHNDNMYKGIRIRFDYSNLVSRGTMEDEVRIRELKTRIIPGIGLFYKNMLSVISVQGSIPVTEKECFGYVNVPNNLLRRDVVGIDLLIFVAGLDSIGGSELCAKDSGVLAAAAPCGLDQFDRPITGTLMKIAFFIEIHCEQKIIDH